MTQTDVYVALHQGVRYGKECYLAKSRIRVMLIVEYSFLSKLNEGAHTPKLCTR